jgi:hypothetical protein
MRHYDYDWDLEPWGITFDPELDIDKLGWRHGDCFKVTNVNGRSMLVKLDPGEQFTRGYKVNEKRNLV